MTSLPAPTISGIAQRGATADALDDYFHETLVTNPIMSGDVDVYIMDGVAFYEESIDPDQFEITDISLQEQVNGYRGSLEAEYTDDAPLKVTASQPNFQAVDIRLELVTSFAIGQFACEYMGTVNVTTLVEDFDAVSEGVA